MNMFNSSNNEYQTWSKLSPSAPLSLSLSFSFESLSLEVFAELTDVEDILFKYQTSRTRLLRLLFALFQWQFESGSGAASSGSATRT